MAQRLPTVNGDSGNWGTILNGYLGVEHDTDGTHKMGEGLVTENVTTVSSSGTSYVVPALSNATLLDITLSDNCEITVPTGVTGQSFTLVIRQYSGGSKVVTWAGNVKWSSGVAPTITTTANAVDVVCFLCIDGTNWLGFVSGQDMK